MNVHHFIKCGALMLLFCICGLTARAQTQTVTLNLRNVSLKQVFGAIEKQTTYRFSYRNVVIDERRDITVSRTNETVQAVLDAVLEGRNLEYKIVSSKSIVISDKPHQRPQVVRKATGDASAEP
ncbi:STN domain-containing protein [Hoylesella enoeca]|uniref:STN domain-containing protein n=1 Tax=Hoylesella enoeca TaxID=76123 RepID=UPI000468F549|nr:STN domain-containing protein [Hoylesella enoeca]